MAAPRFSIIATRAWIDGGFRPAHVGIADGLISEVIPLSSPYDPIGPPGEATGPVFRLPDDTVLLPGLVDTHVHVNEPGRTEWEGFRSATLAAAAGGVTTIVDMPLNSIPPTTTAEALRIKRKAAVRKSYVDVGFWGGAVPENLGSLGELRDAGVFGFKCFLSPSGVEEFGHLDADQLLRAMTEVAKLGSLLIVHAEDPALLGDASALGAGYDGFLRSRPSASEQSAVETVIDGVRRTGCRTHILHLSNGRALPSIRAAKRAGLPLTVETCPHYLTITAEEIPDGAGEFKCCPPIRDAKNRDLLWQGVRDGTIDAIVSDHSPSTVAMKRAAHGDFGLAWGGISGLQLGLAAVWTEAWKRGITLPEILPLFTTGPAKIAGIEGAGQLAAGRPAHLMVFGPDRPMIVDATELEHRNPITAYEGRTLAGRVLRTWLHGEDVFEAGGGYAPQPRRSPKGRLLSASSPVPA
ncbi:MAG TPA: allantoinase AllB [Arachnia sp.]|nr:allantoinase AllB [Arachnia sp.]HMT85267.1 allantoinase AllB [Arachnia sp.]